jgi:hypothetical protein
MALDPSVIFFFLHTIPCAVAFIPFLADTFLADTLTVQLLRLILSAVYGSNSEGQGPDDSFNSRLREL